MASDKHNPDDPKLQFAREVVANEVQYRREKQWRIFSWTSTFLLASIGGVIVLAGKGEFIFDWFLRMMMSVAIATISFYAISWIHENINFESSSRSALEKIIHDPEIDFEIPNPQGKAMFGYGGTIAFLAAAAILAVLFAPESLPCASQGT